MVSSMAPVGNFSKRELVSDIAWLYDVLGWCCPAIVVAKILLQIVWKEGRDWDEPVLNEVREAWEKWRSQLPVLQDHFILHTYFPKHCTIVSRKLHGFSDASEAAYAVTVYVRAVDLANIMHVSLVMAKTKVAPIKS